MCGGTKKVSRECLFGKADFFDPVALSSVPKRTHSVPLVTASYEKRNMLVLLKGACLMKSEVRRETYIRLSWCDVAIHTDGFELSPGQAYEHEVRYNLS